MANFVIMAQNGEYWLENPIFFATIFNGKKDGSPKCF